MCQKKVIIGTEFEIAIAGLRISTTEYSFVLSFILNKAL